MSKGLALFPLLTSVFIITLASSLVNAASNPQKPLRERATLPARMAPVYSFPDLPVNSYNPPAKGVRKIALNSSASHPNPDIVGYTTYDNQHNCTMGRQIEHRGHGFVHFTWTAQDHDILGQDRGIGYQVFEEYACDHIYVPNGIRIEIGYSGYAGLDADPGGWAVIGAHRRNAEIRYPSAFWDINYFSVFMPDNPVDIYGWWDNMGTGPGNENIWPKIEWHQGTETVLHMVTSESSNYGSTRTLSYYRRVGPYGFEQGVWSDQRIIDTVTSINPTITSSPVTDRVAIVWNAPADYIRDTPDEFDNQYENDVWYAISDIQGAEWAADTVSTNLGAASIGHMVDLGIYEGANITAYDSLSDFKAYCDISALISSDDELHIAWGCRRWSGHSTVYRRQSALFHWAENSPTVIRAVEIADWDSGGVCYVPVFGADIAKMSISECGGKFYILFTQFGSRDNPCGDVDNLRHVINGYLYMSAYDPALTNRWDRPRRVTSIPETPNGCTPGSMAGPGTCNTEYWASMARYGRIDTCSGESQEVLDILYINDYAPGAAIFNKSGIWTVNPVMWMTAPCRDVVAEIVYGDNAGLGLGFCYSEIPIILSPYGDIDSTHVTMFNLGTLVNNYTAEIFVDSSNSSTNGAYTVLEVSPTSGTIEPIGEYYGWGSETLTILITVDGEEPNSIVYGHLVITHEGLGSPRVIPICIMIAEGPWLISYTLETPCKKLRIYPDGQMSNGTSNESLDFTDDADDCAGIYLYDGSPIICREIGGQRRCFFSVFGNAYTSGRVLRAVSLITVDSTTSNDFTYAASEMLTADSAIGLIQEYFVPKGQENCGFIIKRLAFWNRTETPLTDVAVGEVLDWDIPSYYHRITNESEHDPTRGLLYQIACGNDPCDSASWSDRSGGVASIPEYLPFKNAMTLENDVFVYASGPFGGETPLPSDTIYGLMTGRDGFSPANLDTCEDLSSLVTFDVYNLYPGDTNCAFMIMLTSKQGVAALTADFERAKAFLISHYEIGECPYHPPCLCLPGDANNDTDINVGDAVYIIGYVFKGGPPPIPYAMCSGDPNGDCLSNVGDAVFLINYIFRGGPAPPICWEWLSHCDWVK